MNDIRTRLEELVGTTVEEVSIPKNNGVVYRGFTIGEEKLRPTLYWDDELSDEENIDRIVQCYKSQTTPTLDENTFSRDFILAHVRRALINRQSNEKRLETLIYREWLDLAVIYKVDVIDNGSISITKDMADAFNLTVEELDAHSSEDVVVDSIGSVIERMTGCPLPFEGPEIYVMSNKSSVDGAATILNNDTLSDLQSRTGWKKLMIIPSSIHEVLILNEDEIGARDMAEMIKDVNATEVRPEEVLADHPYIWDGEVTVA